MAGYGFGMAAVDISAYDTVERFFYAASGMGFINILDWNDPTKPKITPFSMDMTEQDEVSDMKVRTSSSTPQFVCTPHDKNLLKIRNRDVILTLTFHPPLIALQCY